MCAAHTRTRITFCQHMLTRLRADARSRSRTATSLPARSIALHSLPCSFEPRTDIRAVLALAALTALATSPACLLSHLCQIGVDASSTATARTVLAAFTPRRTATSARSTTGCGRGAFHTMRMCARRRARWHACVCCRCAWHSPRSIREQFVRKVNSGRMQGALPRVRCGVRGAGDRSVAHTT